MPRAYSENTPTVNSSSIYNEKLWVCPLWQNSEVAWHPVETDGKGRRREEAASITTPSPMPAALYSNYFIIYIIRLYNIIEILETIITIINSVFNFKEKNKEKRRRSIIIEKGDDVIPLLMDNIGVSPCYSPANGQSFVRSFVQEGIEEEGQWIRM